MTKRLDKCTCSKSCSRTRLPVIFSVFRSSPRAATAGEDDDGDDEVKMHFKRFSVMTSRLDSSKSSHLQYKKILINNNKKL